MIFLLHIFRSKLFYILTCSNIKTIASKNNFKTFSVGGPFYVQKWFDLAIMLPVYYVSLVIIQNLICQVRQTKD